MAEKVYIARQRSLEEVDITVVSGPYPPEIAEVFAAQEHEVYGAGKLVSEDEAAQLVEESEKTWTELDRKP
jgi:hypothetical protein